MIFKVQQSASTLNLGSALQPGKSPFLLASLPSSVSHTLQSVHLPNQDPVPSTMCFSLSWSIFQHCHVPHMLLSPLLQSSPFRTFCCHFGSRLHGHLPRWLQNTFHGFPLLSLCQSLPCTRIRLRFFKCRSGLVVPLSPSLFPAPHCRLHHS